MLNHTILFRDTYIHSKNLKIGTGMMHKKFRVVLVVSYLWGAGDIIKKRMSLGKIQGRFNSIYNLYFFFSLDFLNTFFIFLIFEKKHFFNFYF